MTKQEIEAEYEELRLSAHCEDCYDRVVLIFDSLLSSVEEEMKELFKEVEAREDRVEISDVLSAIQKYK